MIVKRKYPWFGEQLWEDVFFMHWRLEPELLAPYIPEPLQLDTFDGSAWMTVVSFQAKQSRLRYIPLSFVRTVIQTNIRTYVTLPHHRERGVYFFRLLLNHKMVSKLGKAIFSLPFHDVTANFIRENNRYIYSLQEMNGRRHDFNFDVSNDNFDDTSLAQFLTERYCIWHVRHHRIVKVPIIHSKWRLNRVESTTIKQQLHPLINDKMPDVVHYNRRKMSHLFPYETIDMNK